MIIENTKYLLYVRHWLAHFLFVITIWDKDDHCPHFADKETIGFREDKQHVQGHMASKSCQKSSAFFSFKKSNNQSLSLKNILLICFSSFIVHTLLHVCSSPVELISLPFPERPQSQASSFQKHSLCRKYHSPPITTF